MAAQRTFPLLRCGAPSRSRSSFHSRSSLHSRRRHSQRAVAEPEDVGVSSPRLDRIGQTVQQYVDQGKVSGVVTLVLRKGQVVQSGAYGKRDIESGSPMAKDSIFRIASMSKAITSVAAMMLMEEGKLALGDPVSKFIPQFKKTTVAVEYRDGTSSRPVVVNVPAKREITIHDLLTHTSGVSYGTGPAEDQMEGREHLQLVLRGQERADRPGDRAPRGASVRRAAWREIHLRLQHRHPRRRRRTRVRPVARRVLPHAHLHAAEDDRHALLPAAGEARSPRDGLRLLARRQTRTRAESRQGQGEYVDGPRVCFSGGAGLLSTASDYALPADAAERRRAGRRAPARPENRSS